MAPGIPVIIMSEAELPGKDQITCEGTIFKSCKSRFGERYRSQSVTTPPGTSKWNKIEHRLFSFISLNWKGEPLITTGRDPRAKRFRKQHNWYRIGAEAPNAAVVPFCGERVLARYAVTGCQDVVYVSAGQGQF